jgi:hypothetical protein
MAVGLGDVEPEDICGHAVNVVGLSRAHDHIRIGQQQTTTMALCPLLAEYSWDCEAVKSADVEQINIEGPARPDRAARTG